MRLAYRPSGCLPTDGADGGGGGIVRARAARLRSTVPLAANSSGFACGGEKAPAAARSRHEIPCLLHMASSNKCDRWHKITMAPSGRQWLRSYLLLLLLLLLLLPLWQSLQAPPLPPILCDLSRFKESPCRIASSYQLAHSVWPATTIGQLGIRTHTHTLFSPLVSAI